MIFELNKVMSNQSCGKKTTLGSCCCLVVFMIIFIPLYIRGSRDDIQTKCEVLSRDSKSCTYSTRSGKHTSVRSSKY